MKNDFIDNFFAVIFISIIVIFLGAMVLIPIYHIFNKSDNINIEVIYETGKTDTLQFIKDDVKNKYIIIGDFETLHNNKNNVKLLKNID